MPLGESTTVGNTQGPVCQNPTTIPPNEFIGYRSKLYNDLVDSGSFIDFVGSQSNGTGANPAIIDPHHQGNGGDTTSDIVSGITGWLGNNPPDIVLLHIGTNDVNDSNFNAAVSRANIEAILDAIDTWEGTNNSVTVLLSTIIDRSTQPFCNPTPVYNNANVNDLNGEITNLVASRTNDNLILVDQHGAIVPATHISSDGVHPNTQGYENMANEWFSVLTNSTNGIEILSCPSVN
jgi:lysophospholipase L1-like esterase